MRNAVEIIHRAIQRIDDPLMIAGLIPNDTFLAVKRMSGKFGEKQFADQLLRLNIDLQFDVVRCHGVDALTLLKTLAKQLSRFARGLFSYIKITLHGRLGRTKNAKCTTERNFVILSEPKDRWLSLPCSSSAINRDV